MRATQLFSAAALLALTASVPGQACLPQPVLTGAGADHQQLGLSVAVDGDTLLVGAPGDGPAGNGPPGVVLVHQLVAGNWIEVLAWQPTLSPFGRFGQSVDVEGDIAIGGAPGQAGTVGRAFVLERNAGRWVQTATLAPPELQPDQFFGQAVAVAGQRLFVSHIGRNDVHVYEKVGGAWTAVAELEQPSIPGINGFGESLAASGDRVAVGAPFDFQPEVAGSVFTWDFDGSQWVPTGQLTPSPPWHPTYGANFGASIALDGECLAVGAVTSGTPPHTGAVYVYLAAPGGWQLQSKLEAPHPIPWGFGRGVALDGNRLVVGGNNHYLDGGGRSYLYVDEGAGFEKRVEFRGPGGFDHDGVSFSNALDGRWAVSGSLSEAGRFDVFDLEDCTWQDLGSEHLGLDYPQRVYGFGSLAAGTTASLELEEVASPKVMLFVSLGPPSPLPFKGGTLLTNPIALQFAMLLPLTSATPVSFGVPAGLSGQSFVVQFAAKQGGVAVPGVALSNALLGQFP